MTQFDDDLAWSKAVSIQVIRPFLYARWASGGRIVAFDSGSGSDWLQQNHDVDLALTEASGDTILLEEKVVRPAPLGEYPAFFLEVGLSSSTTPLRPGWIFSSAADRLIYGFCDSSQHQVDCYIFEMSALRSFVTERRIKYRQYVLRHGSTRRIGLIVPAHIAAMHSANTARYVVTRAGECIPLDVSVERRAGTAAARLSASSLPSHYPIR